MRSPSDSVSKELAGAKDRTTGVRTPRRGRRTTRECGVLETKREWSFRGEHVVNGVRCRDIGYNKDTLDLAVGMSLVTLG